jgi:hypothetical protein
MLTGISLLKQTEKFITDAIQISDHLPEFLLLSFSLSLSLPHQIDFAFNSFLVAGGVALF